MRWKSRPFRNLRALRPIASLVLAGTLGCASAPSFRLARAPGHIGGSVLRAPIPGIARIGMRDFVFKHCTAVLVHPRFLVTAAHCFGREPELLLNFGERYPDPFPEIVDVLHADGELRRHAVVVSKVHLYPEAFHGSDAEILPGDSAAARFGHAVENGDFAIVEFRDPIPDAEKLPKIRFARDVPEKFYVGGFGLQNMPLWQFGVAGYTGSAAVFGRGRNAFHSAGSAEYRFASEVCVELLNVDAEISYLGRGDSGGGVFARDADGFSVVGVNHAGDFGDGRGVTVDPHTGKVAKRPTGEDGGIVGFAHRFAAKNRKLIDWVESILPAGRFVVDR